MLKSTIHKYFKSEFARNVLTIFTGSSIAQIIPFLVTPILTRLYSPEDFGLLALFTSITGIIAIIATLQYESAIMLPKDDNDALNIVALCLSISLVISIFSFLGISLFNKTIAHWLGNDRLSFWLYFVPISVFLSGLFNTLNYWSSRKKQFKRLAIRSVSQSSTSALVKLSMGSAGATKSGLITGTLAGQATATGLLTWLIYKEDKTLLANISKDRILQNAKTYRNFPKYTAWQGFFDIFNDSSTNFIISNFFGIQILGFYSFSVSLLQKPLQLIGTSVGQVYYQRGSEIYNVGGNIWGITKKIVIRLSIISLIIFVPIAIAGPKIFSLIFGKEWYNAGVYARLLLPWLVVRFIGSPITSSMNILGKQKEFLFFTVIINLLFPLILLFSFKNGFPFTLSILFVSIITSIYLMFIIIWIKRKMQ